MNGVHDMGGMHGLGPIDAEPNEPVFHAPWERRVFALTPAVGAWPLEHRRRTPRERDPAAGRYLEQLLRALAERLDGCRKRTAWSTQAMESTRPGPARPCRSSAEQVPAIVNDRAGARPVVMAPELCVGQGARAAKSSPTGHTRLPRYCAANREL